MICVRWGEPGGEWTQWGWRNEEGSWFHRWVITGSDRLGKKSFPVNLILIVIGPQSTDKDVCIYNKLVLELEVWKCVVLQVLMLLKLSIIIYSSIFDCFASKHCSVQFYVINYYVPSIFCIVIIIPLLNRWTFEFRVSVRRRLRGYATSTSRGATDFGATVTVLATATAPMHGTQYNWLLPSATRGRNWRASDASGFLDDLHFHRYCRQLVVPFYQTFRTSLQLDHMLISRIIVIINNLPNAGTCRLSWSPSAWSLTAICALTTTTLAPCDTCVNITTETAQTIACSAISSRIDYCNSLLYGAPVAVVEKLQRAQNNVARVIC